MSRMQLYVTAAGLLGGVAKRSSVPEYARLLGDCHVAYCEARVGLVAPVVHSRFVAMGSQPLPVLTRSGAAYLMQVCPTPKPQS